MENKCVNCRYFRQGSIGPTKAEHVWGDCLKATEHAWGGEDTGPGVSFAWADGCCEQFEPKDNPEEDQTVNS